MEPTADGLVELASDIQPTEIAPPETLPNGASDETAALNGNGHDRLALDESDVGLHQMLHALQAVRIGDFSVRLPGDRTGLTGKIADTFNEIVAANERMAGPADPAGQLGGPGGKTRHRGS